MSTNPDPLIVLYQKLLTKNLKSVAKRLTKAEDKYKRLKKCFESLIDAQIDFNEKFGKVKIEE